MSSEKLHVGDPAHFINDPTGVETPWRLPSQRKVGMISLIATESALFTIFVVAYLFYMGRSLNGPYPSELLHFPWAGSAALFSSSLTIFFAEKAMHAGKRVPFLVWWGITMLLGMYFVYFSASEWYEFIFKEHFTLSTNVFGSTFYSLVGLHLSHVFIGLLLLSTIWLLVLFKGIPEHHLEHVEMISWYWHFVDAIWVVVVTVVYIISVRY